MSPILGVLAGLALAVATFLVRRRRARLRPQANTPDLRGSVLRGELFKAGQGTGNSSGSAALMDWNIDGATATLAAFSDGAVSLYFSTGGGVIGAGAHPSIRGPATQFHALLAQQGDQLTPTTLFDPLRAGEVLFWLARPTATSSSGPISLTAITDATHRLAAAHAAAQATITAIREQRGG